MGWHQKVSVLDSLDPSVHGTPPAIDGRAELVLGSLTDSAVVAEAVSDVDAVYHQPAKVGLGVDFGDVGNYVATNHGGTAVLLEALWRRSFTGRVVPASGMVIYGEGRSRCRVHGLVAPGPRPASDLDAGRFEPPCPVAGCGRLVAWVAVEETCPPDRRNVYAATKLGA